MTINPSITTDQLAAIDSRRGDTSREAWLTAQVENLCSNLVLEDVLNSARRLGDAVVAAGLSISERDEISAFVASKIAQHQ